MRSHKLSSELTSLQLSHYYWRCQCDLKHFLSKEQNPDYFTLQDYKLLMYFMISFVSILLTTLEVWHSRPPSENSIESPELCISKPYTFPLGTESPQSEIRSILISLQYPTGWASSHSKRFIHRLHQTAFQAAAAVASRQTRSFVQSDGANSDRLVHSFPSRVQLQDLQYVFPEISFSITALHGGCALWQSLTDF